MNNYQRATGAPSNPSARRKSAVLKWLICAITVWAFTVNVLGTPATAQVTTSVTEPFELSHIAAVEQGVIERIAVQEGQKISAGEVLATMDLGVLQQQRVLADLRAKSQSKMGAAKAELKLRTAQKENMNSLINHGHANPFEVDQTLSQYEKAVADYRGAVEERDENRAELAKIDKEIDRRGVRSPIDGIVTEIQKRPGEYLSANDPVFATVVQLDRLRVRFYLNADETTALETGQQVTVYVGKKRRPVIGTIEFVSPIVEPKTGLARVNVVIDNPSLNTRSGIVCYWSATDQPRDAVQKNHTTATQASSIIQ